MKKKTATIIVVFIMVGTLIRFVQVLLSGSGSGNGVESPDKKYLALASDFHGKKFWGGTHNYYEFTVQTAEGRHLQHVVMDEPLQGMISWRENDSIQWTSNSSSVTYTFKGGQLTLSVLP
jgi:hypothetical protein